MPSRPDPHAVIGANVRRWRQRNRLTQADLAQTLRLTREAISEIERGHRKLTFLEADLLHRIHGLPTHDLSDI